MIKLALSLILAFGSAFTFACSGPAPGTFLNHADLIEKTKTVVLVELIEGTKSRFKVVETLKGTSDLEFQWIRFRTKQSHASNDFDGHSLEAFWTDGDDSVIRSPFHGGACFADFTFVTGEKYLIFVETYGNHHSAEIIKSNKDRWYQFVKKRVTHNQSLKNDADKNSAF